MAKTVDVEYKYENGDLWIYFIHDGKERELHRKATADERRAFISGIDFGLSIARSRMHDSVNKIVGSW